MLELRIDYGPGYRVYLARRGQTIVILLCGGSSMGSDRSAEFPATNTCSRMPMTKAGVEAGWQVEKMPGSRVLGEAILLPDGKLLILNGAASGAAGFGTFKNTPAGQSSSNADNPQLQPWLYSPNAPSGSRFSTAGLPVSKHARMVRRSLLRPLTHAVSQYGDAAP